MKARVAALATVVLTAAGMLTAFTPGPATAQGSFGAFQAYANGTKQHARVIDANGQTVGNVDTSFSAAAANSQGLKPINNVFNEPAVPTTGTSGKNSYGRGAAAEVGLGAKFPANQDPQQIILPTLTESAAAPSTPLTVKNLAEIPADPLLYVSAATNKTQALWNPDFCPIGQPISYGENDVANAQLINANSAIKMPNAGSQPLLSETPSGDYTTTNFNQSYTYLYPTGPSTFGVGAVNRQVLAPVTIGRGLAPANADLAVLTLLGTWQLRVEDSGNGAPTVTYAAYDNLGNQLKGATAVATLSIAGTPAIQLTAQQVFGPTGLTIDIPPQTPGAPPTPTLAQVHIGTPPTAIAGMTHGYTTDAVVVNALNVPSQIDVADVRYGHMEAQAVAPAGGVSCTIPASKVFTDANGTVTNSLQGGNNFTWKITFPTVDISKELACDLTNVTVTDVATATGAATATITGADHGGKVTSGTVSSTNKGGVTWNLGTYHPGDPPVVLTITGTLGKGAGTLTNTANISATLGNCTGGALGKAFVTNGSIGGKAATIQGTAFNGNATTGAVNVSAAAVLPARLAETGQKEPWLPVVGGGLLLGALALMRSRRRLTEVESQA